MKRGIYDFLTERKTDGKVNLIIDPNRHNPIDRFFTDQMKYYHLFAIPFQANAIIGWYVLAKNKGKMVQGKIVDIYATRD